MAENYVVNYNINVQSQAALQNINRFYEGINKLTQAGNKLTQFQKKIDSTTAKINQMSQKVPVFDINTTTATTKLNAIIAKLREIRALAKQTSTLNLGATGGATKKGGANQAKTSTTGALMGRVRSVIPRNISYRTLGHTMIDTGGLGAFDMLKGMGIAYGIAGIGSLMGQVVRDASDYDNIMKTTQNILKTHDKKAGFDARFKDMSQLIRNVGVETKFTAPQVADASKFLAMAGFDIESINQAIRPIADIALVGDTDLGETADVVTNIMTGYRIRPEDVRKAADVMTMTFTKTNTTLMEIAESYKYASSLLSAAGIRFEESTGAIGVLGDAGIKGSQAGTSLRTIVSNIVNPTKTQKAQWDKLKIQRFNKDGSLRSLIDIFEDLNAADLSVDVYYKMFHRTAAQGAVALTNAVGKWNDIIRENFLSDSLSQKLADEKKNTIQGLWYQLTSSFTEVGMKAFERADNPVRVFLNEAIAGLKSQQALNVMNSVMNMLMELANAIKTVIANIAGFYNKFKLFIDAWLHFQVTMMPILITLRAFKAFFTSMGYLTLWVFKITAATKAVMMFGQAMWALRTEGFIRGYGGFVVGSMLASPGSNLSVAQKATNGAERIKSWTRGHIIGGGAAAVGGGVLGGIAGNIIGKKFGGESGQQIGTILGATLGVPAGIAFMSSLMKIWPQIVGFFSGPLGWAAIAAAAIGGAGWYLYKYAKEVDECTRAHHDFLRSVQLVNGINMSEGATTVDKYMSIIYNKQMSTNQAIGEHIRLIREQLGLMDSAATILENKTTFKEAHKSDWDRIDKVFGFLPNASKQKEFATSMILDANGEADKGMLVGFRNYGGLSTNWLNSPFPSFATNWQKLSYNGVDFGHSDPRSWEQIAVARMLYGMGKDTRAGSETSAIIADWEKRFSLATSESDWQTVWGQLQDELAVMRSNIIDGSKYWTKKDIEKMPMSDIMRGYHWVTALQNVLLDHFNPAAPFDNVYGNKQDAWLKVLQQSDAIRGMSGKANYKNSYDELNRVIQNYLLTSGVQIFDSKKYGDFGSPEMLKYFGYYDNQWHAGEFDYYDKDSDKIQKQKVTAEQARKSFVNFHEKIVEIVRQLDPLIAPYFNSFIEDSVWSLKSPVPLKNGEQRQANGKWEEWVADKVSAAGGQWKPITDPVKLAALGPAGDGGGSGKTPIGGSTGIDQSNYKSHYNNGNSAPKQIIVKIDKLMSVDSIDLSNPDNAAVIADLKAQLTQALVDVVHDFDESFHG